MLDLKISLEYILSAVGLFALWNIRQEFLTKSNEKSIGLLDHDIERLHKELDDRIDLLEQKQNSLESKVAQELSEIKKVLVRIETILEYHEKRAQKGE